MVESRASLDPQVVAQWLSASASESDVQALAEAAEAHPASARLLQREQQLHHVLIAAKEPGTVKTRLHRSVMAALTPSRQSQRQRPTPIAWPHWGAAAAVAAALALAALWWSWPQHQQPTTPALGQVSVEGSIAHLTGDAVTAASLPLAQPLMAVDDVAVQWQQSNRLQLTAGSQFHWSDADLTRLHLDQGSAEVVIEQGPFRIQSPVMTAEVLGTAFALHHGWWGSSVTVTKGRVGIAHESRHTQLTAGEGRWVLSAAARAEQQGRLLATAPAVPERLSTFAGDPWQEAAAWQGSVSSETRRDGLTSLQGSGRFVSAVPEDATFIRLHLRLDRLDGRAGLAVEGDSRTLAGADFHRHSDDSSWELQAQAWRMITWPGFSTWLVEGQVNGQPIRVQVDSPAFALGLLVDGRAEVASWEMWLGEYPEVWVAPHPQR